MIIHSGRVWRVKFTRDAELPGGLTAAAGHPEGRFHHDGQRALYASDTPQGAVIATQSYLAPGDPPRAIYPLALSQARLIDLADPEDVARHGLDVTHRAARWLEDRTRGLPARTWAISDAARAAGADGMIYASRKRPELRHLVLFRWNDGNGARLAPDGAPLPFPDLPPARG